MVRRYPANDALGEAISTIAVAFKGPQANRVLTVLDNQAQGLSWAEQSDQNKSNIANRMMKTIDNAGTGSAEVTRVFASRKEVLLHLPPLLELMQKYEQKHGPGTLGRVLSLRNTGAKLLTGYPRDADLSEIFTLSENIVGDVLVYKSGAGVTDAERAAMRALIPGPDKPWEWNVANGLALLEVGMRGARDFYEGYLGKDMSDVIMQEHFTADVTDLKRERMRINLSDEDKAYIESQAAQGTSRQDTLDFLSSLTPAEKQKIANAIAVGLTRERALRGIKQDRAKAQQ